MARPEYSEAEDWDLPMRLYPQPCKEVDEIYGDLRFPESSQDDISLPYVVINMVSSLDGKISSGGKSGAIGSATDRETMRILRSKVDAVMAGAGTLRAEKVSLSSEGKRNPEPKGIISTASLDLPLENLIVSNEQEVFFLIPEDSSPKKISHLEQKAKEAKVINCKRTKEDNIDLQKALEKLKSEHAVGSLLLEGGPGLNQSFISQELVSEIFLTLSPKLLGGIGVDSTGIISGSQDILDRELKLTSVFQDSRGELFLRYKL